MKQVISNEHRSTVLNRNTNPAKFYGVTYQKSNVDSRALKAFLSRRAFDGGNYFFQCVQLLNRGNTLCEQFKTFGEAICWASSMYETFEFETAEELLAWCAKFD